MPIKPVAMCLVASLVLAGCVSTTSYKIISKQDGPQQTTIFVEAPATSTQQDMQGWASHLEKLYKAQGKAMMINFYNGGRSADHLIGTYQGASVHRVNR